MAVQPLRSAAVEVAERIGRTSTIAHATPNVAWPRSCSSESAARGVRHGRRPRGGVPARARRRWCGWPPSSATTASPRSRRRCSTISPASCARPPSASASRPARRRSPPPAARARQRADHPAARSIRWRSPTWSTHLADPKRRVFVLSGDASKRCRRAVRRRPGGASRATSSMVDGNDVAVRRIVALLGRDRRARHHRPAPLRPLGGRRGTYGRQGGRVDGVDHRQRAVAGGRVCRTHPRGDRSRSRTVRQPRRHAGAGQRVGRRRRRSASAPSPPSASTGPRRRGGQATRSTSDSDQLVGTACHDPSVVALVTAAETSS